MVNAKRLMSALRRPTFATIVFVLGILATSSGIAAAGPTGAADGRTGDPAAREASAIRASSAGAVSWTITPADAPGVFARAAAVREALGFPSRASTTGRHVRDGALATEYDAVDDVDGAGAPIAEFRFASDGRLEAAVRLDTARVDGRRPTASVALVAARRGLAAVAISPAGSETVEADSFQGGWQIHWGRAQRGIPVRGDETRVHVRADGFLGSVTWIEHQLAPEPGRRIGRDAARGAVAARGDAWFAGTQSGYRLDDASLQWVAPNGLFDATASLVSSVPYRLAWVVNVKPTGPAALSVSLITVFVDAGDGSVIGGDVVE